MAFPKAPASAAVIGEHVRIAFQHFRKLALEGLDDARVDLNALALEHGAVSGILHQRVLEGVDGVRDDAALVHQLGSDQLPEQRLELGIAEIADRP